MTKPALPVILFCLIACGGRQEPDGAAKKALLPGEANGRYAWTKLLDSAGWRKSYNFQLFSLHDTLWTFHHDGVWLSADGFRWMKSPLSNVIGNGAFLDYVVFKGTVYGLGHFEGNIETFIQKSSVYSSGDLRHWDTVATESNLPNRFFYHPFVYQNKLWIIGGEDKTTKYADVWNSPDGIAWTKQRDSLPFGRRSGDRVVELKGRLYLLGNDVWSSTDGLRWQKETDEILKGEEVSGYAALAFDDRIWLLGCNRNGRFSSQVLTSTDGKTWQSQEAPWAPRGGIAATVHQNKLYLTGGKYGGTPNHPDFRYDNDLWMLSRQP